MEQLSKGKSILYHLYPGIVITLGFILLAPWVMKFGYPPQLGMLISVVLVVVPLLLVHLTMAKKREAREKIADLNGYKDRLPTGRLILYSLGLVVFAFLMWGVTQPLNQIITDACFSWLPDWYTVQDFSGYGNHQIKITLIANLVLNGVLAPFIEEFYFRGYLLPRMESWGKSAFIVNAVLFSLYHFWQPYIYITLIFSLLPMTYLVWKTRDLRLAMLTHCLMNLTGAILSFGLLQK